MRGDVMAALHLIRVECPDGLRRVTIRGEPARSGFGHPPGVSSAVRWRVAWSLPAGQSGPCCPVAQQAAPICRRPPPAGRPEGGSACQRTSAERGPQRNV